MDLGFWALFILLVLALGPWSDRFKTSGTRKILLLSALTLTVLASFVLFLLEHGRITSDDLRMMFGWLVAFLKMGAVLSTAASVVLPDLLKGKS